MSLEDRGLSALSVRDATGAVASSTGERVGFWVLMGMALAGIGGVVFMGRRQRQEQRVRYFREWAEAHPELVSHRVLRFLERDADAQRLVAAFSNEAAAVGLSESRELHLPLPSSGASEEEEKRFRDRLARVRHHKWETSSDLERVLHGVRDETTRRRLTAAKLYASKYSYDGDDEEAEAASRAWYEGDFAPSYPDAHPEDAARIALGEPPGDVYRPIPAKEIGARLAENKRARSDDLRKNVVRETCSPEVVALLMRGRDRGDRERRMRRVRKDLPNLPPRVAEWLVNSCRDPGKTRVLVQEREFAGPRGERFMATYADHLGRAADVDVSSPTMGTARLVENVKRRRENEELQSVSESNKSFIVPKPAWWRDIPLPGGVVAKVLRSAAGLRREGREMEHCAATYQNEVCEGATVLVSLTSPDGERSTVEIRDEKDEGLVGTQHRGRRNAPAPASHHAAADAILAMAGAVPDGHWRKDD